MIQAEQKTELNASAEEVWEIVSNFNAFPRYIELVENSIIKTEDKGTVRTLTLGNGETLKEKLIRYDFDDKTIQYTIVEGPLPVKNYLATMTVAPTEDGCLFTWSGKFNGAGMSDEDAAETMSGVYQLGCEGLKRIFG
jgi:hypothetical protein